jgi:hypothetical protein
MMLSPIPSDVLSRVPPYPPTHYPTYIQGTIHMSYPLPSINDLYETYTSEEESYIVTEEQASKILNHTGAIQEAETELYKALHHFNSLSLKEQVATDEFEFHPFWVVWLSKGMVHVEPMYDLRVPNEGRIFKCFDRSDAVVLQTLTTI